MDCSQFVLGHVLCGGHLVQSFVFNSRLSSSAVALVMMMYLLVLLVCKVRHGSLQVYLFTPSCQLLIRFELLVPFQEEVYIHNLFSVQVFRSPPLLFTFRCPVGRRSLSCTSLIEKKNLIDLHLLFVQDQCLFLHLHYKLVFLKIWVQLFVLVFFLPVMCRGASVA